MYRNINRQKNKFKKGIDISVQGSGRPGKRSTLHSLSVFVSPAFIASVG